MTGHKVQVVDEDCLIATDLYTDKLKVVVRDNGKIIISEEFDAVQHLHGSDYNLVRLRKKSGVIYKADKLDKATTYSELGKCA